MSEFEDDKDPSLHNEILDQLAFIRAALEEVLRRLPEPKCLMCGLARGFHDAKFGNADHEFTI